MNGASLLIQFQKFFILFTLISCFKVGIICAHKEDSVLQVEIVTRNSIIDAFH